MMGIELYLGPGPLPGQKVNTGWPRLGSPRSRPAAPAQHRRVWPGEAGGASTVDEEAAGHSIYLGRPWAQAEPLRQVALLQVGVRGVQKDFFTLNKRQKEETDPFFFQ